MSFSTTPHTIANLFWRTEEPLGLPNPVFPLRPELLGDGPLVGYPYDDARMIRRALKQASRGFQGVGGSFD
jgi:hypothetical protein